MVLLGKTCAYLIYKHELEMGTKTQRCAVLLLTKHGSLWCLTEVLYQDLSGSWPVVTYNENCFVR